MPVQSSGAADDPTFRWRSRAAMVQQIPNARMTEIPGAKLSCTRRSRRRWRGGAGVSSPDGWRRGVSRAAWRAHDSDRPTARVPDHAFPRQRRRTAAPDPAEYCSAAPRWRRSASTTRSCSRLRRLQPDGRRALLTTTRARSRARRNGRSRSRHRRSASSSAPAAARASWRRRTGARPTPADGRSAQHRPADEQRPERMDHARARASSSTNFFMRNCGSRTPRARSASFRAASHARRALEILTLCRRASSTARSACCCTAPPMARDRELRRPGAARDDRRRGLELLHFVETREEALADLRTALRQRERRGLPGVRTHAHGRRATDWHVRESERSLLLRVAQRAMVEHGSSLSSRRALREASGLSPT